VERAIAKRGATSLRQKESSEELIRVPEGSGAVRKSDCGVPTDKKSSAMGMEDRIAEIEPQRMMEAWKGSERRSQDGQPK